MATTTNTSSSPLSFVGATKRLLAWPPRYEGTAQTLAWVAFALALPVVWSLLSVWYVVIFVFLGWFTIPWRLLRRAQRKSLHVQERQLEVQQRQLEAFETSVPTSTELERR
jgi:hypothetical protein